MASRFDALFQVISVWPRTNRLTAFSGVRGSAYDGELLVIGRATNGWMTSFTTQELQDAARRQELALEQEGAWSDPSCLGWVVDRWGKEALDAEEKRIYNPARSAFWRVIRKVRRDLGLSHTGSWSSSLAWSNLYRVAPAAGGNPSGTLMRLQHGACCELLREDIDQLTPKRILFLTGASWFQSFEDSLGFATDTPQAHGQVERTGRVAHRAGSAVVVVARHPQGKPEQEWVDEVVQAFTTSAVCK